MQKYVCPECGTADIQATQCTIQEIDPFQMIFRPPETLMELKCDECGWFASTTVPSNPL